MTAPRRLVSLVAWMLLPGWIVAQTTTPFTWTGNSVTNNSGYAHAHVADSGNWVGGVAPTATDPADLVFGSSAGAWQQSSIEVQFPTTFQVRNLTFNGPIPYYYLVSDDAGTLRIAGSQAGESSLTLNGSGYSWFTLNSQVELLGNQNWTINDGTIFVSGRITQSAPSAVNVSGNGTLFLYNSDSDFSGGLNLQSGTLVLNQSSSRTQVGDAVAITGPIGSGTLTLGDFTTLRSGYYQGDVTLHNPIALGNYVSLGSPQDKNSLTLAGAITPQQADTTIRLGVDGALFIQGNISNAKDSTGAPVATSLTFTRNYTSDDRRLAAMSDTSASNYFPIAVLSGTNTYTGATAVDNAGVIFFTPGALGQTSSISATSGYVGTGYSGGMEAILTKIAAAPSGAAGFDGALGFDTNPDTATTPTVFADNVNLSAFAPDNVPGDPTSGFWGLGTMTSATLTGTITPPTDGNYVFGGGSGKLYVQSNLGVPSNSTAAGVRVRSFSGNDPLTVWLQGNNSFAGNLMSDHSIVVLDSANALPTASSFSLDSGAYVGYTENFTAGGTGTANLTTHTVTPAEFISRLASSGYGSDSILGFDTTTANLPAGRTISDAIDLRALNNVYIGTSSHVHLAGTLTAPNAETASSPGQLSVTGINGGWLTIDSALLASAASAPGVTSLYVGSTASDAHRNGYVELTSGNSTFAGGTTLKSGYLLLGASSTVVDGVITQGPLGTGAIEVEFDYGSSGPATIAATTADVTLHNNFNFSYGSLQFGVPVTSNPDRPGYAARAYTSNGLTLNGNFTGTASAINFVGNGTFTLNGADADFRVSSIVIGDSTGQGAPRIVANTDTALGTNNGIYFHGGGDLVFGPNATAPSLGNVMGYDENNGDKSFIALTAGSTLTINQQWQSWLYANIGGAPTDGNFTDGAASSVNASIVKTGPGDLTLAGINTYSGNTTIKSGILIAGTNVQLDSQNQIISGPFGTGSIILDGGSVGTVYGVTLRNPITFSSAGGTLAGNGTIASPITIGTNVKIAPGNSPGQLTLTNTFTLASGGTAAFDIANFASSAGSGWDQIVVTSTGTFAITATVDNPFYIQINSWSTDTNSIGALTSDFSVPTSLALIQTSATITGLIGDGQAGTSNLVLDTTNFTNYQYGAFSLSLSADNTALVLNFSPVPEPSTYALFGLGLLAIGASTWRAKRARRN